MGDIAIEQDRDLPVWRREAELVERKGIGHPDTICDSIMESVSVALSQEYLRRAGRVLHHNIDKGLLVAGQSIPAFGGGRIVKPMRLVLGDRATDQIDGQRVPVTEIAEAAAADWLGRHLRWVDPVKHLTLQNELLPGSAELVGIYAQERPTANDTSAAVGFAPLSETEQLVMRCERLINSDSFKQSFPESGEDVKVMGVRRGRQLHLTVALAFVDRFVSGVDAYVRRKAEIEQAVVRAMSEHLVSIDGVDLAINTLDDPAKGIDGTYLTVLGTSAESADGGQVGRGNRPSGLITLARPMSLEAAAGKNPVSHVGKVYHLLAYDLADEIYRASDAIEQAYVWLCSRIGYPLNDPWFTCVRLTLAADAQLSDVEEDVHQIVASRLASLDRFTERLVRGQLPVC